MCKGKITHFINSIEKMTAWTFQQLLLLSCHPLQSRLEGCRGLQSIPANMRGETVTAWIGRQSMAGRTERRTTAHTHTHRRATWSHQPTTQTQRDHADPHTERPVGRVEPRTFLLWRNSAVRCATLPVYALMSYHLFAHQKLCESARVIVSIDLLAFNYEFACSASTCWFRSHVMTVEQCFLVLGKEVAISPKQRCVQQGSFDIKKKKKAEDFNL